MDLEKPPDKPLSGFDAVQVTVSGAEIAQMATGEKFKL